MSSDKSRIAYEPSATGPRAMISGTRASVADIAQIYQVKLDELLIDLIAKSLPHLSHEQVGAALDHWRQNPDEIEDQIGKESELTRPSLRPGELPALLLRIRVHLPSQHTYARHAQLVKGSPVNLGDHDGLVIQFSEVARPTTTA